MTVLDSIRPNGAKLVEMSREAAIALRKHQPGIRVVPIVLYRTAVRPQVEARMAVKSPVKIKLRIISKKDGRPVAGVTVVAVIDFHRRIGSSGTTDQNGDVSLALGGAVRTLERLYLYPPKNFWSGLIKNIAVRSGNNFELDPVNLEYRDALRHFYGNSGNGAGRGVTVGIVDTGIDMTHPDLKIQGGRNTVVGEKPGDFGDNGEGHGTHVAGIIAARGIPPTGIRGLAPAANIRSYRVFGKNKGEATNYAIAKAIDQAVEDGCDLINMSLGGGKSDAATRAAIEDARLKGTLVIVASGNDDRAPVSFPASDSLAVAVSAMGRVGTFPALASESGDVASPYGKDKKNFVADFSNIGSEIDLTGPGVGILSTVPGGYAPMSGTSMSCPAATGLAAKVLADRPEILRMKRSPQRSDAIAGVLYHAAQKLGFGPDFEGHGLLETVRTERG